MRDEASAVGDEYVFHIMHLVIRIYHAGIRIIAHARGAALVNVLAEDVQLVTRRRPIFKLQCVHDFAQMIAHSFSHGMFIFAVTRVDMQRRNAPGVFLLGVERDVIIMPRKTFALRINVE